MSYRIECSAENGILLWIEAPCGIKQPLMHWPNLKEVRKFGEVIINYCEHSERRLQSNNEEALEDRASIAANLLRQVFNDEGECDGQEDR